MDKARCKLLCFSLAMLAKLWSLWRGKTVQLFELLKVLIDLIIKKQKFLWFSSASIHASLVLSSPTVRKKIASLTYLCSEPADVVSSLKLISRCILL